ncbi:hypothetical protein AB205_0153490 [Aquarana catesbeiana]|uniref:Uncharacterized protein n=1 Tax=Aquarana catesbeiana TaxID=8400 RepID=A0A2G9QAS8_AQUCT|nr:hypothetical protein AB205_0153490 [Aquarana catesbeiana]
MKWPVSVYKVPSFFVNFVAYIRLFRFYLFLLLQLIRVTQPELIQPQKATDGQNNEDTKPNAKSASNQEMSRRSSQSNASDVSGDTAGSTQKGPLPNTYSKLNAVPHNGSTTTSQPPRLPAFLDNHNYAKSPMQVSGFPVSVFSLGQCLTRSSGVYTAFHLTGSSGFFWRSFYTTFLANEH